MYAVNPPRCACGHPWTEHTRHASGAQPCRSFGCGCSHYHPLNTPATKICAVTGATLYRTYRPGGEVVYVTIPE